MLLHHIERRLAPGAPLLDLLTMFGQLAGEGPESQGRDEGFVAVLLEGHPLQHPCLFESIFGPERGLLRQIEENGIRLGETATVGQHQERYSTIGIQFEKFRRARLAAKDIEFRSLVLEPELRQ